MDWKSAAGVLCLAAAASAAWWYREAPGLPGADRSAAAAEPSPAPPRPLTALEGEVLRHALGERAAPLLGAIRHLPRGDGRASDCERASALIADVLRLPAPERRLAVRLMFDRG
jgi:hypothetical protein